MTKNLCEIKQFILSILNFDFIMLVFFKVFQLEDKLSNGKIII